MKTAVWREVAASVLPNINGELAPELVKKRWKSLRDTFRRYFSGHMQSQTSGADDVQSVDTDWPLVELFLFLNDRMVTRPTSGNYVLPESPRSGQVSKHLNEKADATQQHSNASEILIGFAQFQAQDFDADISDISGLVSASQVSSPASVSSLVPASTS
ncbi:hypothetical protein HPB49_022582 [Dermacentor silvarum]|uniref:Uncharacterized protein n=1 Tax=Dermacentor silvarum TaxID=543639 RepID=A0ACB8DG74_DERSI|nr:hypothetical protein HPB49_022582 [Dermacentor silvarum]